jgi:hypothetical protein
MRRAAGATASRPRETELHRGRVLCRAPLIVTGATLIGGRPLGLATPLSLALGARPAIFLIRLVWQVESARKRAALVDEHRWHAATFPHHRVVVLANTVRETWRLRQAGIPCFHCNNNAFVDEHAFDVFDG